MVPLTCSRGTPNTEELKVPPEWGYLTTRQENPWQCAVLARQLLAKVMSCTCRRRVRNLKHLKPTKCVLYKCYIASSPTVPLPTGCTGRMAGRVAWIIVDGWPPPTDASSSSTHQSDTPWPPWARGEMGLLCLPVQVHCVEFTVNLDCFQCSLPSRCCLFYSLFVLGYSNLQSSLGLANVHLVTVLARDLVYHFLLLFRDLRFHTHRRL